MGPEWEPQNKTRYFGNSGFIIIIIVIKSILYLTNNTLVIICAAYSELGYTGVPWTSAA